MGLKVGIYSSAGTETCGGYPASISNEYLDASTFSAWGIDYLKYDNCYVPANWTDTYNFCVPDDYLVYGPYVNGTCPVSNTTAPAGYDWGTSNTAKRYGIMRDALEAQNRTILYSLCEWGQADVEEWGNSTGNSWRIGSDITPTWERVAEILNLVSFLSSSSNFWGHNDADMLEIGNGNLTSAEERSHFAFWAAVKSPLIIGTDLGVLATEKVSLLKNKALLAFSQDEEVGGPATPYKWGVNADYTFNATSPAEYWSGAMSGGSRGSRATMVLALNSLEVGAVREIKWTEVPELSKGLARWDQGSFEVTDVWTGQTLGCVKGGVTRTLQSHDTMALVVGNKC